ncbi:MAG: NAD(P)/FAD-dependent oxidoreductase [Bacillota bacterium]|nr:NAD(P)/FAD-dependent oxidoreductase [Bacillota bacterium]
MAPKTIVVIGGGPGGIMAAWAGANAGSEVILLEKNKRLGRKLLITGKGRCNVTNNSSVGDLVKAMVGNGKFLYGAFNDFSAADTIAWLEESGVALKTERGKRVFPLSDRSGDIVEAMERRLKEAKVSLSYNAAVTGLIIKDGAVAGVNLGKEALEAGAVIIATGGLSYPATGSTGDGYKLAQAAGHSLVPPYPALVPLLVKEKYVAELEGLSLRNAEILLKKNGKVLAKDFGEMVFTDFGLSGPVILTISHLAGKHFSEPKAKPLELTINLKPALSYEQLDQRLLRDFASHSKRSYKTLLQDLLPKKLIPVFIRLSGIDPAKEGNQLNREDRKMIIKLLREFPFTVTGCRPIAEAIVTAGGVNIKEIDPKTMASKKLKGLYFAGEVMDIHGVTGGFNIQAALSCGYRSGKEAAEYIRGKYGT